MADHHHSDPSGGASGGAPESDDSGLKAEPTAADGSGKGGNGLTTLGIVRGYVLLILGVGLIIFGVAGPIHPGAMTLGGALVGFNPLFKATMGA